jgi:predicted membrane protein
MFLLASHILLAMQVKEKITKNLVIPKKNNYSEVHIRNLFGSVTVEAYEGNTLLIEATKTIYSNEEEELEKIKSEINIAVYEYDKGLFVYSNYPCAYLITDELRLDHKPDCAPHEFYKNDRRISMDIIIKVPHDVDFLSAGAVDRGDVYINGMSCDLNASNVKGSIKIEEHSGNVKASTVDGDVYVDFSKNPDSYATFHTIFGKVEVFCLKDLSAKVHFKSLFGDFFTDYEDIGFFSNKDKNTKKKNSKSVKYKLGIDKSLRIGNGRVEFDFKSLYGNMYLKRK